MAAASPWNPSKTLELLATRVICSPSCNKETPEESLTVHFKFYLGKIFPRGS